MANGDPETAARPKMANGDPETAIRPEMANGDPETAVRPEMTNGDPETAVRPKMANGDPETAVRPDAATSDPKTEARPDVAVIALSERAGGKGVAAESVTQNQDFPVPKLRRPRSPPAIRGRFCKIGRPIPRNLGPARAPEGVG